MMKTRTFLPVVAVLFAVFTPTHEVSAQLAKNTNQSRKLGSVLVGGSGNLISSNCETSFIGGGRNNAVLVGSAGGMVGGGARNTNSAEEFATIGGGADNTVAAIGDTVSGGRGNTASGGNATVGGGSVNLASSPRSTVPGGSRGKATNSGSFVWSGDATEDTSSFADNTFTVRAEGGVRFYTANGTATRAELLPGATDWAAPSDSNLKTKVTAVDSREILSKLSCLPVTEWQYKDNPDRRYIGPMAQDFHAAFGLGYNDKTISTLDSDGVMYAAIQGLVEELKERDKEIAELKAEMDTIKQRLNSLPPAP